MGAFVELGFKYIRTYIVLRFIRKTKQELSSSGLMSSSLLDDRTPSPPVDSDVSATESEIRRDIERARNRYVDDEAEESDN